MPYRISVDTGGTFTDVVIADENGIILLDKALTTPDRIINGMLSAMAAAAAKMAVPLDRLLSETNVLIYGTTRATNAIVQRKVAKTAMLLTEGFPDILVFREGGKFNAHEFSIDFPDPYIPRRFTFEVPERVNSEGEIVKALDRDGAVDVVERLRKGAFEAVAVSFLWSIANPANELAMAELLEKRLPGVPYSLSHRLLPIIREYRRASATAIDASLKPLMQQHLREMAEDLRAAGFHGEILVSTSAGGCLHVDELVERPIQLVKSGPSMAPVAGRVYTRVERLGDDVIVCDTGGTTFDVGLVREGELVYTRESWLGPRWTGHIISTSAVDIRSIGAGGGSIAWIDSGGLLRVGPQSAGSVPGPACYGRGGEQPTVTDAALVLGYIDPGFFLGGRMKLDMAAALHAVGHIADQLHKTMEEAAFAIIALASEHMIRAIHEITINEGFNPEESALVAGGGAAGLNIMPIARELRCKNVILPRTASALSACGMQYSDIVVERSASRLTVTDRFDFTGVNAALDGIDSELASFVKTLQDKGLKTYRIDRFVEARYLTQVWELDVQLPTERIRDERDVAGLTAAFHAVHERVFAVTDPSSPVECLNWRGRVVAHLSDLPDAAGQSDTQPLRGARPNGHRMAFFGADAGMFTPVYRGPDLQPRDVIAGPAIIEEPTTTIVVYPGGSVEVSASGNFILSPMVQ
jgi:N-methylhydantoinase A